MPAHPGSSHNPNPPKNSKPKDQVAKEANQALKQKNKTRRQAQKAARRKNR